MTKVAIVGYAVENQAALRHLRQKGADITVCDQDESVVVPEGIASRLGPTYLDGLDEFDTIVRTVGMHPDTILAQNPGVEGKITTAVNLFFEECKTPIIGVTGTKGKGTTSTLITKILEAAGKKVLLGGNIGVPMLDLLPQAASADYIVLELSSFQLIDCKYSSHIAVCLMVVPEHIDWHGDTGSYFEAKRQLFNHQQPHDIAIYYGPNETSRQIAGTSPGTKIPYYEEPGAVVKDNAIYIADQQICRTDDLKLLGKHNWQNVCAAVTAAWQVTQDVEAIRTAVVAFSGLPFRIELRKEVNAVRFYNDSFATQPEAAVAACESVPGPKVLIIGGYDRMLDLTRLAEYLAAQSQATRKIIVIGAAGPRIVQALEAAGCDNFVLTESKDMATIVKEAASYAQPGDAVILSPGFASFDMFKNFEERGKRFNEAVEEL